MMQVVSLCVAMAFSVLPGQDAYLGAFRAQQAGHYAEAATQYQRCIDQDKSLRPYAQVALGECRAALRDPSGAEALYRGVLEPAPDGPWKRLAQLRLAQLLCDTRRAGVETGRLYAATLFANQEIGVPGNGATPAPKLLPWWLEGDSERIGDCLLAQEDTRAQGYAWLRVVMDAARSSSPRIDAMHRLLESPAAEDRLAAMGALLRGGMYVDVGKALETMQDPIVGEDGAALRLADAAKLVQAVAPEPVKSRAQKPTLATLAKKQAAKKGKKTPPPPPVPAPSVKPNIVTLEKVEALANANRENPWMRIVLAYAVRAELGARHRAVAESLADVLDRVFPAQRETGDALWALASYCEDAGAIDSALLWYKHLVDDCPKHYRADAAQFQIGRRLYQADKKEEAIEAFVALGKNYPTSTLRSQGYYLCGTMASAQGDAKRARMYFVCASFEGVGDFFAHRALERMQGDNPATGPGATNLKIDGAHPVLIPIPNKRAALEPLPEAIENDPRLARIRFFGLNGIEAGEWEALETMHAVQDRPDAGIWYAAIAEAGYAHTATQWIESIGWGYDANHRPEGGHLRVWFPRAYWSDVCAAAKAAGVDPYLVLSVMRQESTYRPSIVSSSGAVGLMQLMPGTAQWLTHVEPAIPAEAAGNLRVPPYSVQLGAHYLGRMINQSGGNLIYALAAYNAGPGNCDKWRKSFGNLGPDAFIDNIPFAETKNYVRRVLANYAAYHSLYAPVK